MKKKRLLSLALSVTMLFGSASMLPEDTFCHFDEQIVFAEGTQNTESINESVDAASVNFFDNNKAQKRTKQQIIDYMNKHPFMCEEETSYYSDTWYNYPKDTYEITPEFKNNQYVQGKLSKKSLGYSLNTLNVIRYIAGLDEVSLNDEYNDYAQAASLCNAANNKLSHYPDKPSGMSDSLYDKCANGARRSNIGMGYNSISQDLVKGWMFDGQSNNRDTLGHRRWCLNPSMGSVGFGHTGDYTAMYAVDQSKSSSEYTVAWPAPCTPYTLFYYDSPWSVSKNGSFSNNTVVTLKRKTDNKTWIFEHRNCGTCGSRLYISNDYYGQYGCIIFIPEDVYDDDVLDDSYEVSVVDGDYKLNYNVDFFHTYNYTALVDNCYDQYSDNKQHTCTKWTVTKKATCTAEGLESGKCSVCGKAITRKIKKLDHKCSNWKTAKKATCTADGKKTGTCSVCGTALTQTIKATGHDWGYFPEYNWNGTSSATATFTCKNDPSHKKTLNAKITSKTISQSTCSKAGEKECKATVVFEGYNYSETRTFGIPTTAHKWGGWTTTSFNVENGTSTQKHTCSVCKQTETKTVSNAVTRFAGANRYDTAAKLSKSSYRTADTVIIADAMTFQDALIAVPLASAYNAPLLLANPNTVTTQTETELKRLKAKKVIIVNTANALKSNTINALKKYNPTIISGKNCFETSKKVAETLQAKIKTNTKNKTTAPTDVFFTTNKAFADALSVSPVAALKGAPILYVDPSKKTLDSNITAYLNKVKGSVKNVYIVGGLNAIPKALENSIKSALPKKNYKRFDGATRYETCVMINQYFAGVLSSKTVCVAKGLDFPDALAGGVFAAKHKAPLILADNALKDAQKNYLKKKAIDKLYIFGGTVAVPDKLAKEIAKASV